MTRMDKDLFDKMNDIIALAKELKSDSHFFLPRFVYGNTLSRITDTPPIIPDKWDDILNDLKTIISPQLVNTQHPRNHSFFPVGGGINAIVADCFSSLMCLNGFSWMNGPAIIELQIKMIKWLSTIYRLDSFNSNPDSKGAFVGSCSEGTLLSMITAKYKYMTLFPDTLDKTHKFVVYFSELAHVSARRGAVMSFLNWRICKPAKMCSLHGSDIEDQINVDMAEGMIPIMIIATAGTTACGSFDDIGSLIQLANKYSMWLHIDAAYGGNSLISPSLSFMPGHDMADSIVINPAKAIGIPIPCSMLWIKSGAYITDKLFLDIPYVYMKYGNPSWAIGFSQQFVALKVWMELRGRGIYNLIKDIDHQHSLSLLLKDLISKEPKLELLDCNSFGMVAFRLSSAIGDTETLYKYILSKKTAYITTSIINDKLYLRIVIHTLNTTIDDMLSTWKEIQSFITSFGVCGIGSSLPKSL